MISSGPEDGKHCFRTPQIFWCPSRSGKPQFCSIFFVSFAFSFVTENVFFNFRSINGRKFCTICDLNFLKRVRSFARYDLHTFIQYAYKVLIYPFPNLLPWVWPLVRVMKKFFRKFCFFSPVEQINPFEHCFTHFHVVSCPSPQRISILVHTA